MNHVKAPNDNLPSKLEQLWRSVYDPLVILEALILENTRKHFAQAKATPFTRISLA
jgi:hypothetical protein